MARQDLKDLGFKDGGEARTIPKEKIASQDGAVDKDSVDWETRKQKGFVAGIKR